MTPAGHVFHTQHHMRCLTHEFEGKQSFFSIRTYDEKVTYHSCIQNVIK